MSETVQEQIFAIRDSGVTNMLDINRVQYEAYKLGFHALVDYLIDHRKEYSKFIVTGIE